MLSLLFVVFLLTNIFLHLWLASRQARHVRGHRAQTPAEFSDRIELCSHQRAADYTLAQIRLLIVEQFVVALILIGLTLLGGLQFLTWNLGRLISHDLFLTLALLSSYYVVPATRRAQ